MKNLVLIILVALLIGISPLTSLSGELEDAHETIRQNPDDALAHYKLGNAYGKSGQYPKAILSFKEAIRLRPNFAEAHYNLGLSFGRTKKGFDAITHTLIAGKLFERQNNSKLTKLAKIRLQKLLKIFPKYRAEDFADVQIPRPSAPDDIQLIINSAKGGYLTEELHKKYWSELRKNGGDENTVKIITNWYPNINRLQLNFNREMLKSLKMTLKNKKITS